MTKTYAMIVAEKIEDLEAEVSRLLEQGAQPVGGLVVIPGNQKHLCAQAMLIPKGVKR